MDVVVTLTLGNLNIFMPFLSCPIELATQEVSADSFLLIKLLPLEQVQ